MVTLLAALAVLGAVAPVARADDPPCTADQVGTKPPPVDFSDPADSQGTDLGRGPLAVGHAYILHTNSETGANGWQLKQGSVRATGPPDVPLTDVGVSPGINFRFTPTRIGVLRFVVTWQLEGPIYPNPTCTASATVDLSVATAGHASVSGVRFVRARFRLNRRTFEVDQPADWLTLTVKPGRKPLDLANVTILVRIRKGRAKPPAPRGRAAARFVIRTLANGTFGQSEGGADFDSLNSGVDLSDLARGRGVSLRFNPGAFQNRTLRFGISIEVLQGSRRIGGLRSGLICRVRHKTFHVGANTVPRRGVTCAHPGFRARP
jgi:hypothetical protein